MKHRTDISKLHINLILSIIKMKIRENILQTIRKDLVLREQISTTVGSREINVYNWAYRGQHNKFTRIDVMEVLMDYFDLTKSQILEPTI